MEPASRHVAEAPPSRCRECSRPRDRCASRSHTPRCRSRRGLRQIWGARLLGLASSEHGRGDAGELPALCISRHDQAQARTTLGYQRFNCRSCRRRFNERTGTPFNDLHYPTDVVLLAVLWRLRYKLSFRDVAEMLLQQGVEVTQETRPTPPGRRGVQVPVRAARMPPLSRWVAGALGQRTHKPSVAGSNPAPATTSR